MPVVLSQVIDVEPEFGFFMSTSYLPELMSTVISVFVESALKNANDHNDAFLLAHVRQLFANSTGNATAAIVGWEEFEAQLEDTFMHELFLAIVVEIAEAESLFHFSDVDADGSAERARW